MFVAVRYGRVPKRSRERERERGEEPPRVTTTEPSEPAPTSTDSDTKTMAAYDIILTVSQAHHANCEYTEEQTRSLSLRKPIASPVNSLNFITLLNYLYNLQLSASSNQKIRIVDSTYV